MSDFDEVLERLLTDPSFPARLAADPAGALAGYDLDADEAELLRQQVSSESGAQAAVVEDRITKSSTFGIFSSFGIGGMGGGLAREGFGSAPADGPAGPGSAVSGFGSPASGPDSSGGSAASGIGSAGSGLGEWSEFGSAAGTAANAAAAGLGSAPDAWGTGGADMSARSGFGSAPGLEDGPDLDGPEQDGTEPDGADLDGPDLDGLPAVVAFGDAPRSGIGAAGEARTGLGEPEHRAPPKGYDNQVDADGDGSLDKATYRGREGGGAEIRVDLDGDGRADFIGVDKDLDNRVDFADYDKDHDGVFEKRMFDDDGDGFLDRSVLQ